MIDFYEFFTMISDFISKVSQSVVDFWGYSFNILGFDITIGSILTILLPVFLVAFLIKKFVPLT